MDWRILIAVTVLVALAVLSGVASIISFFSQHSPWRQHRKKGFLFGVISGVLFFLVWPSVKQQWSSLQQANSKPSEAAVKKDVVLPAAPAPKRRDKTPRYDVQNYALVKWGPWIFVDCNPEWLNPKDPTGKIQQHYPLTHIEGSVEQALLLPKETTLRMVFSTNGLKHQPAGAYLLDSSNKRHQLYRSTLVPARYTLPHALGITVSHYDLVFSPVVGKPSNVVLHHPQFEPVKIEFLYDELAPAELIPHRHTPWHDAVVSQSSEAPLKERVPYTPSQTTKNSSLPDNPSPPKETRRTSAGEATPHTNNERLGSKPPSELSDIFTIQPPPLKLAAVRFWSLQDFTRVAIEMNTSFTYSTDRLNSPDRVVFTLRGNAAQSIGEVQTTTVVVNDGVLRTIRYAGVSYAKAVRVICDMVADVDVEYTTSVLTGPDRLLVEFRHAAKRD